MDKNEVNKKSPLKRMANAFKYSLNGLVATWKDEQAFRQELIGVIIFTPVAFFLPITLSFRLLLIFSMFCVLAFEVINSAIEALTDLITKDIHPLAKKAKDCGSAAVLLVLGICLTLWMIALYLTFVHLHATYFAS